MEPKTPRHSEAVIADIMMPHHANGLRPASVFGGVILSMMDRCAGLSAVRYGGGQATTLSHRQGSLQGAHPHRPVG